MTNKEMARRMLKLTLWRQNKNHEEKFYDFIVERTALLVESEPVKRFSGHFASETNRAWVCSPHSVLPVENVDMIDAIERLFNSRLGRLTGQFKSSYEGTLEEV